MQDHRRSKLLKTPCTSLQTAMQIAMLVSTNNLGSGRKVENDQAWPHGDDAWHQAWMLFFVLLDHCQHPKQCGCVLCVKPLVQPSLDLLSTYKGCPKEMQGDTSFWTLGAFFKLIRDSIPQLFAYAVDEKVVVLRNLQGWRLQCVVSHQHVPHRKAQPPNNMQWFANRPKMMLGS